jgi:hypothetical protein
VNAPCKLCEKKRARRHCPGIEGDICPSCCGAERENSIDCPSSCEYLQEARLREHPAASPDDALPHPDIRVSEDFLREKEPIVVWISKALTRAMEREKAVDQDAREALEALIRTYRTLDSGLIYETRPTNPYAAALQDALKTAVEKLRPQLAESAGLHTLRDADILGVLVFLLRIEFQYANGRRRGRAFYDFLNSHFPAPPRDAMNAPVIAPVSPLVSQ